MRTGVTVCVLCGPSPSLVEIETELLRNWKTTFNLVASLQSLHPRGFPAQANFDQVSTKAGTNQYTVCSRVLSKKGLVPRLMGTLYSHLSQPK